MNIGHVMSASPQWATSGASAPMPPSQKMSTLFNAMDASGSGAISKQDLQIAFNTLRPPAVFKALGVDKLFSQLDTGGSGQVSKDQFVQTMTGLMSSLRNPASTDGATNASSTVSTSLNGLSSLSNSVNVQV